jgi:hypothetical protein
VTKLAFAKSVDLGILVETSDCDAREKKEPICDGCDAFVRWRNGGMKGESDEETERRHRKTPVVVNGGDEGEEEEGQKTRNGKGRGELFAENFGDTFIPLSWLVHR